MAKNQTSWTKEEIALLMENYPKYGTSGEWVKGLQPEHQKRTAILGAAGHYGIRFYKAPVAWTTREIALIREHYPNEGTTGEWVKELKPEHQTAKAISGAAGYYGVRFYKAPVAWTTREMMLIREHYPNEGATGEWVKELKPEHQTAKAISARAAYLGIRRKSKPRKVAKNDQ